MKNIVLIILLVFSIMFSSSEAKVTVVAFSKDRPMQLYALLESSKKYLSGDYETVVIYTVSNASYEKGYSLVKKDFPKVFFVKQRTSNDLKQLTVDAIYKRSGDYIMLAVDDIVVKSPVNLNNCVSLLERTKAHGFYLRLGKNTTESYSLRKVSGLPQLKRVESDVFTWQFLQGKDEWRYIGSFDMTIYRKTDIKGPILKSEYNVPNGCEAAWQQFANPLWHGLCFEESKIVNIPVNLVQSYASHNRCMESYSTMQLLKKFMDGNKIDIEAIAKIHNRAPHMEYELRFVPR